MKEIKLINGKLPDLMFESEVFIATDGENIWHLKYDKEKNFYSWMSNKMFPGNDSRNLWITRDEALIAVLNINNFRLFSFDCSEFDNNIIDFLNCRYKTELPIQLHSVIKMANMSILKVPGGYIYRFNNGGNNVFVPEK